MARRDLTFAQGLGSVQSLCVFTKSFQPNFSVSLLLVIEFGGTYATDTASDLSNQRSFLLKLETDEES